MRERKPRPTLQTLSELTGESCALKVLPHFSGMRTIHLNWREAKRFKDAINAALPEHLLAVRERNLVTIIPNLKKSGFIKGKGFVSTSKRMIGAALKAHSTLIPQIGPARPIK